MTEGFGAAAHTIGSAALDASPALLRAREVRVRPARRLDVLARFADAFDLAEEHRPGHADRVAWLAHEIALALGLTAEERRRVLHVGLLHDAGIAVRIDGGHHEGGAWVAERFGFDEPIRDAISAIHERWDGQGRPLGRSGAEIPVEALCVSASHWACEFADHVGHPLRARTSLQRASADAVDALVGAAVGGAAHAALHDDDTWLALWDEDLATLVAEAGGAEGKPSRRKVEAAAQAIGAVVDSAVREPGRSRRVALLAGELAVRCGMPATTAEAVRLAGHLLDVGQLGVPRHITCKPSILTVDEMELMRRHPGLGARILESVPGMDDIARWVEQHHERPDGRGYPEMLALDELPLPPRILAIADAYWAPRAARPYRPGFDADEALEMVQASAGHQFDADVVEMLAGALDSLDAVGADAAG